MATYSALLADVLVLSEAGGATDIQNVAKLGLVQTLKYIARQVRIPGLIGHKTYQWQTTDTAVSLTDVSGFNATNYDTPFLLLVGDLTDDGPVAIPYGYHPYDEWLVLRGYQSGARIGFSGSRDQRFERAWTVNFGNEVELTPIPDDETVHLYYMVEPAAYSDAGTPEITGSWQQLLIHGATYLTREFIENIESGRVLDFDKILSRLDPEIQKYKQHLDGFYKRHGVRIAPTYSPKGS